MIYLLASLMGFAVGLILGFFGSGGSILAVPLLVYGLNIETKSAIAMSLVIVGGTAFSGVVQQWRQGRVVVKAGLTFGSFGLMGSFAGARFSNYLTGNQQLLIFGVIMLGASLSMMKKSRPNQSLKKIQDENLSLKVAATMGVLVGLVTGLIGVGGGFLIVPALAFGGLSLHRAIGTSLMVIVMNCAAGTAGYWKSTDFQPDIIAAFLVPSTLASLLGVKWGGQISAERLKKIFAAFLLIVGVAILLKNAKGFW